MSADIKKLIREMAKVRNEKLEEAEAATKTAEKLTQSMAALEESKSAKKQDVIAAVEIVLSDNAPRPIEFDDLKGLTQDKLRDRGFNLTGAFKNFKRYLDDADNIVETDPGNFGLVAVNGVKVA